VATTPPPRCSTRPPAGAARCRCSTRAASPTSTPLDAATYRDVTGKPATQPGLSLQSWGADRPSGGPFLIPIFDGRQIITAGGNFNLAQYDDPQVNAEIDAIDALTDPARAAQRWGALDAKIGAPVACPASSAGVRRAGALPRILLSLVGY
jgi:hypothetical protein